MLNILTHKKIEINPDFDSLKHLEYNYRNIIISLTYATKKILKKMYTLEKIVISARVAHIKKNTPILSFTTRRLENRILSTKSGILKLSDHAFTRRSQRRFNNAHIKMVIDNGISEQCSRDKSVCVVKYGDSTVVYNKDNNTIITMYKN